MAKYTKNGIYTYVRNALKEAYPDLYITDDDEPIPPNGVAVKVHEIDHSRPFMNATLDGLDEQWRVAFDVNVYSNLFNGSDEETYEIMHVAEQAFRELFFFEMECVPVERANNRVSRLTARCERHIGGGDEMPVKEAT